MSTLSVSQEQKIKIIAIKDNYFENKPFNHKFIPISNIIDNIKNVNVITTIGEKSKVMNDKSEYLHETLFEIIGKLSIPYFDVEGIKDNEDENNHSLIYQIADSIKKELTEMSKKDVKIYKITYNNSSHSHEGKSYHLYFPEWATYKEQIHKFVNWYIDNKKFGYEYIDGSVYSSNRLFRLPYQQAVNKVGISIDINERCKDFHRFIGGQEEFNNIADYIIGNVKGKNIITFPTIPNRYQRMKTKNVYSGPFNIPKKIEDMCDAITTAIAGKTQQTNTTDENIYNKAVALRELIDDTIKANTKFVKLIDEFIAYYKEHNNKFVGFRLTVESINIILDMISKKI